MFILLKLDFFHILICCFAKLILPLISYSNVVPMYQHGPEQFDFMFTLATRSYQQFSQLPVCKYLVFALVLVFRYLHN